MVVLRINNADLPDGWTHNKTDWQIATDKTFKTILAESMNDDENLTTKIFNLETTLGVKYYGRARMLLNTGFTEWSNIDVFIPDDVNEVLLDMDIPSVVSAPTLTTVYEKETHPTAAFKVHGSKFSSLGNAEHISTTWILEDDQGNALWASIDDINNLTSIEIMQMVPKGRICRLHASYKGSNGDCSQFGSITYYVSDDERIVMPRVIADVAHNLDYEIDLPYMDGLDKLEWELYIEDKQVHSETIIDPFFIIDESLLLSNKITMLRMRVTINGIMGDWTYIYMTANNSFSEVESKYNIPYLSDQPESKIGSFPLAFPYKLISNRGAFIGDPAGPSFLKFPYPFLTDSGVPIKTRTTFPLKLPYEVE